MAEDAGSGVYASIQKVLGKLRGDLGDRMDHDPQEVKAALRTGLDEGTFAEDDLRAVVWLGVQTGDVGGQVGSIHVEGNAYSRNTFNIERGDFKG